MATADFKIPDPFVQTAFLHDEEENILHVAAIKYRVTGQGNLDSTLYDLDLVTSQPLAVLVMALALEDEPVRLANFKSQRILLKTGTDAIDEVFNITRIIAFFKKLWTDYPK